MFIRVSAAGYGNLDIDNIVEQTCRKLISSGMEFYSSQVIVFLLLTRVSYRQSGRWRLAFPCVLNKVGNNKVPRKDVSAHQWTETKGSAYAE